MEGSAAVIGEMMLPVLEPTSPEAYGAGPLARAGLPADQLPARRRRGPRPRPGLPAAGGPAPLRGRPRRSAGSTPEWRAFLAYEIERNRALYAFADTGIALLPPRSARCVGTARVLYAQILDRIERRDYDVFSGRARVPTWRKAVTAARIMVAGPPRRRNAPSSTD